MRLLLCVLALLAVAAPAAGAATPIAAHRGGALADGVMVYGENTLPAFRNAAKRGWILELDVKLTRDRQAVVIHDDTLDRTTDCAGLVSARTAAELRRDCRVDVGPKPARIPTLAEVAGVAADHGATISPEIKNIPPTGEEASDFDPTPAYATTVAQALRATGFPQERMIVQSFWPPNLDAARPILPDAQLSFLTLEQMNAMAPAYAAANDYDWVSPGNVTPGFVQMARALGRKVVPYTLNTAPAIASAAAAGVDAIITDDPVLAERVLGHP